MYTHVHMSHHKRLFDCILLFLEILLRGLKSSYLYGRREMGSSQLLLSIYNVPGFVPCSLVSFSLPTSQNPPVWPETVYIYRGQN